MRGVILGVVALCALVVLSRADAPARADGPPPEYAALYAELSANLTEFEATLDAEWDDSVGDSQFAGGLSAANGEKSIALLTPAAWTRIIEMLDAFETMGVELIKIDTQYPVMTPAFQTYLNANPPPLIPGYFATVEYFIGTPNSFYNKLVAEIRSRGMGVWIEHGTLFGDYTPTPPAPYFAEMRTAGLAATQARYTAERAAEVALIVSQLEPDYFTILEEPDTQAMNFGYFPGGVPIFDENGWVQFVEDMAAEIDSQAPGAATLLGAGIGTWSPPTYVQDFAVMPELDFIDIHIYPFESSTQDFLQRAIDWADYVHAVAPEKRLTIGEAWAYKESAAEVDAGFDFNTVLGRDVWSFWAPLDEQYLDVLFKLMHSQGYAAIMPFWSQYYFAYLEYGDPEYDGLGPIQLIGAAATEATPNIASVTLTGTGAKFQQLLAAPMDADGDGVADATDNCDEWVNPAQQLPPWPVQADDDDCDGFTRTAEEGLGTSPADGCPDTATPNDEADDKWPADLNDNRVINTLDLTVYATALNQLLGNPAYVARADLNSNGVINTLDLVPYATMLGKVCVP